MKTITVIAQEDHLERLANVKQPISAIEELVWNSLDADATLIEVSFELSEVGGVTNIYVKDNGLSIPYEESEKLFSKLGGSWKKHQSYTKEENRILHGKYGQGRFKAFALGNYVSWECCFSRNGTVDCFTISGRRESLLKFSVGTLSQGVPRKRGTLVTISEIQKKLEALLAESAVAYLEECFALYLYDYSKIKIKYDDKFLDPSKNIIKTEKIVLENFVFDEGEVENVEMVIVEWSKAAERYLCLCSGSGFLLTKKKLKIHVPGFNFSVYVKSNYLQSLFEKNQLYLDEMHAGLNKLLLAVKNNVRDYFRSRRSEESYKLIAEWKREEVYPYLNDPKDEIEIAERQVFDILALNINEYLPDFVDTNKKSKKLSLQLIKEALERDPGSLHNILENVLCLPKDKIEDLDFLLKKTTLSNIISASKNVADRLNFMIGLEHLLFDHEKYFKERSQLHKILAQNTWIFGEEYNLSVNDSSLNEVLKKHVSILGRDDVNTSDPVKVEGKARGIVDMMLSRRIPQSKSKSYLHLIVELKRPSKKIDFEVETQIKQYAFAVADDSRFSNTNTKWVFWVLSNEMTDSIARVTHQKDRPEGLLHEDERVAIWAVTWSQVIRNCKARLSFFQERLHYETDKETAMEYLKNVYEKYLPKSAFDTNK